MGYGEGEGAPRTVGPLAHLEFQVPTGHAQGPGAPRGQGGVPTRTL